MASIVWLLRDDYSSFVATQSSTKCPMDILECYHQSSKDALSFACEKRVAYELKIGA